MSEIFSYTSFAGVIVYSLLLGMLILNVKNKTSEKGLKLYLNLILRIILWPFTFVWNSFRLMFIILPDRSQRIIIGIGALLGFSSILLDIYFKSLIVDVSNRQVLMDFIIENSIIFGIVLLVISMLIQLIVLSIRILVRHIGELPHDIGMILLVCIATPFVIIKPALNYNTFSRKGELFVLLLCYLVHVLILKGMYLTLSPEHEMNSETMLDIEKGDFEKYSELFALANKIDKSTLSMLLFSIVIWGIELIVILTFEVFTVLHIQSNAFMCGEVAMEKTLFNSFYFVITSISTVGYGDIVPSTTFGKFTSISIMLSSMFYLVLFLGILFSTRIDIGKSNTNT